MPLMRYMLYLCLALLACIPAIIVSSCDDKSSGPDNHPPVIDSIVAYPDEIHPGAEVILTAYASDPDGDSIVYSWFTYPKAGGFSDSASPSTGLTVSTGLVGGMSLKVMLNVNDKISTTYAEKWISIIAGKIVSGYVYFIDTKIPVPGVEVSVRQLKDTSGYNGDYLIKHVPPGGRTIEAEKSGCNSSSKDIVVNDDMEYNLHVDCPEFTKTVSGNVSTKNGIALSHVLIRLLNPDSSSTPYSGLTDNIGNFSISGIPPGNRIFAIEDAGNPDYQVMPDTIALQVGDDANVPVRGKIRTYVFISNGIENVDSWSFVPSGSWKEWQVDTINNCLGCNWCEISGIRMMKMAAPILIPQDAGRLSWTADLSVVDAVCEMAYVLDGKVVNSTIMGMGTADLQLDDVVQLSMDQNAAGHYFSVEFYAWSQRSNDCSLVCLRKFTLSYYE